MTDLHSDLKVPVDKLRWRLDRDAFGFSSTDDLEPLDDIIGQDIFHLVF